MNRSQHTSNRRIRKGSIAVSRLSANYAEWLRKLQPDIQITGFNDRDPGDFAGTIQTFSGLLLPGGGDIHPGLYGNPDIQGHCRNVDIKRDDLEWKMIEAALEYGLPILAICRGMQMLNIVRGGTLFTDIPAFVGNTVLHRDHHDVNHPVSVSNGSLLYRIAESNAGIVNSAHHQAVDRLAAGFVVTAFSEDGVVEAIEYNNGGHGFCVGVQWHPERMDPENPMSGKLGRAFIESMVAGEGNGE